MEQENKMEEKGRVCVTGGTGFIASWLIKNLLQDGYSVNTTIRSSRGQDRKNISYLTDLPGASERLRIFNADLDKPDSFDAPIEGCIGVFHLVHPMDVDSKETEEAVMRSSVGGTTRILQACLNSQTVKRVLYTSSAATIFCNDRELDVMDETIWSDVDFIRTNMDGHIFSTYRITKTETEKAAFEFAEENGLDLVSTIPTFVHGPFICPFLPISVRLSMAMIFGHQENYSLLLRTCFVHIDDLVRAHIFLLENPNAKGRYICSAADLTIDKLAECLSARYPEYPIPTADSLKDISGFTCGGFSSKKLLDLGFKYNYGIEEMFDQAIECCKQKGFL